MPRKMAIEATSGNVKQLDARMDNIRKRNAARLGDAESVAASIDGKVIVIEAKSGADGKLFGSVTTLMIEEAAAAQLGADIDHKRMNLHRPIKTAGVHEVVVAVYGDVKATLVVKVVGEGAAATASAVESPVAEAEVAEVQSEEAVDEAIDATDDLEASDEDGESAAE
jgi:large subunit ribosomal protein L9